MQLVTFQNRKMHTLSEWLLPASRNTTADWTCHLHVVMLGGYTFRVLLASPRRAPGILHIFRKIVRALKSLNIWGFCYIALWLHKYFHISLSIPHSLHNSDSVSETSSKYCSWKRQDEDNSTSVFTCLLCWQGEDGQNCLFFSCRWNKSCLYISWFVIQNPLHDEKKDLDYYVKIFRGSNLQFCKSMLQSRQLEGCASRFYFYVFLSSSQGRLIQHSAQ